MKLTCFFLFLKVTAFALAMDFYGDDGEIYWCISGPIGETALED